MNNEEKSLNIRIPCRHLRNKEMYHQDLGQEEDQYSSGLFWCGKTHESFGPDGQPVGKNDCCAGRTCHIS